MPGHQCAVVACLGVQTELCVARMFVDQCLALHAKGNLDSQMASMAKYWCSDLQMKIAHDGVQMHGGWGYMYARFLSFS